MVNTFFIVVIDELISLWQFQKIITRSRKSNDALVAQRFFRLKHKLDQLYVNIFCAFFSTSQASYNFSAALFIKITM